MTEINALPEEMMMRMFRQFPPRDLKMAVLVSRKWRTMGEDPSLWKWCRFIVRNRDDIRHLSIPRLQDIQEICVDSSANWQDGDLEAMFRASIMLPRLKEIVGLTQFHFSTVEPELFARAVSRLEVVNLCGTNLTNNQIQALFQATDQSCQLKKLDLWRNNISSVEPELFARAVTILKDVNLGSTNLTNKQVTALFQKMSQNCPLKTLNLSCINLSYVEPELLAIAVNRLEDVDLEFTDLSTEQMTSILSHVKEDTKIQVLGLGGNDLSSVESGLISTAFTRLVEVDLRLTKLSTDQMTSILSHVMDDTKLKNVVLYGNDLSSVEPGLLATAVNRLEDVDLRFTELSTEQMNNILSHVKGDTKLKELWLRGNNAADIENGLVRIAREKLGDGLNLYIGHIDM